MGPFNTEEGLTVDTCTACRAAWFDRGELARMVGTREDLPALDAMNDFAMATSMPCLRCANTSLVEMPYHRGLPFKVATCPTCQGVLSSLVDLRTMRELAASERVARAAQNAQPQHFASSLSAPQTASLAGRTDASLDQIATRFSDLNRLTVKQRRSWFEALTGFEQPNTYTVIGNGLGAAFVVSEQTSGLGETLMRLFLGPWRPFTSFVEDTRRGTIAMKLYRPFRWFLPELEVRDADNNLLARIVRRWTWFTTRYEIFDAAGAQLGEIHGPFFRPWTFEVMVGGSRVALVQKKWSGLIKEALTDADNFEVTFDASAAPKWKPLALACAVMIDVAHFERSNK